MKKKKKNLLGALSFTELNNGRIFLSFVVSVLTSFSIEFESYLLFLSIFSNLLGEAFGSQGDVVSMVAAAAAASSSSSSSSFFFFFVLYETTQVDLLFFSFWVCQPIILPLN